MFMILLRRAAFASIFPSEIIMQFYFIDTTCGFYIILNEPGKSILNSLDTEIEGMGFSVYMCVLKQDLRA